MKSPQLRIAYRIATRNLRLWILLLASASLQAADFDAALLRLNTRSFDQNAVVAADILATGHHRTKIVLNALLEGHLYAVKQTDQIVIAAKSEGGYVIADAATGTELGFVNVHPFYSKVMTKKLFKKFIFPISNLFILIPVLSSKSSFNLA